MVSEPTVASSDGGWPTHRWSGSAPEAHGVDANRLDAGYEYLTTNFPAFHTLITIRHGVLVYERQNPDAREPAASAVARHRMAQRVQRASAPGLTFFDQLGPQWNTRSVAKSVLSAIVGIAIDRGLISSVDQPLVTLLPGAFPDDTDDAKRRITLRHLLTMTSGLASIEEGLRPLEMMTSENWVQYALSMPMVAEPGKTLIYNSGNTHLLSAAITAVTGQTVLDFANQYLFHPLGIRGVVWEAAPEGITFGSGNLFMAPRDMAKMGYLYLRRGRWEERRLLSEAWIEASLQPYHDFAHGFRYGYLWYLKEEASRNGGGRYMTISAAGIGGQKILIVPALDLVVVATAKTSFADDASYHLNIAISEHILPAIAEES